MCPSRCCKDACNPCRNFSPSFMSLMKPTCPPNLKPDEFVFEFTDKDPNLTPTCSQGESVEFSLSLLKAFEVVRSSKSTYRYPCIDGN